VSALRAVLAAVTSASAGTGLAEIARRLDLSVDEVGAMVDYWVRRGRLVVEPLAGCGPAACAGCRLRGPSCPAPAATPPDGRVPVVIRPARDD
jgi:hypothetical protein